MTRKPKQERGTTEVTTASNTLADFLLAPDVEAYRKQEASSSKFTWASEPYIARNAGSKKGFTATNVHVISYGTNALCIEWTPLHIAQGKQAAKGKQGSKREEK